MRFAREQYLELLTFGRVERQMFVELFGPLVGLEEEWRRQGAREDEISLEAFDWDWVPVTDCGGELGPRRDHEPLVLEETADYRLERDHLGRTVKLLKGMATIGLPLDYPVRTMEDWQRLKPLYRFSADRIRWDKVEEARRARDRGALVVATMPGAFDTPRELMGDEAACISYYEQPELMQDILDTITDTACRVLDEVSRRLTVDQLSVHEDLAGKSGPIVGPVQVDRYFRPYYREAWAILSARGARVFQMDSDGNIAPLITSLLDCGLTAVYPVEPAAGMDCVALRRQLGRRLAMLGGIDKHVLRRSPAEIRRELEYKMQPLMREGGMVFGLDHRIPNGTPLANYRYYVAQGRELLGIPPLEPGRGGWARMAF
jgi:uroporphyrinogen-III decarboxylase